MNEDFEVIPSGVSLGAEIRGLDLREPVPVSAMQRLYQAWLDNLVLLFRDQDLTDEQHFAFTRQFGPLEHTPDKLLRLAREGRTDDSHPEVTVISNVVEQGNPIGRLGNREAHWHTDSNFVEVPPAASLLRSLEIPAEGGNTSFMNMYAALDALPVELRQAIDGRHCKHDPTFDSSGKRRPEYAHIDHPKDGPGPVHPLVRTHADSGRRCLYLGRRLGAWITDMTPAESDALLDRIWACITAADLTWEHSWRVGDLIMWDNRRSLFP
jgi:taurine dioxygenase